MSQANFQRCLSWVLQSEGGYVDDPRDPGGATNKGITQAVYDAYRTWLPQPKQPVKLISQTEVADIYQRQYWDKVSGDELSSGVDYAVFDAAVNSGVIRAIKWLQVALDVPDDGVIGVITLQALAEAKSAQVLIQAICNQRVGFLERLRTWDVFGKGWANRVANVQARSLIIAKGLV